MQSHFDRYILEIKPIMEEDIYDEDDDERIQRSSRKIKLADYKICEARGCEKYNDVTIYLLSLIPKLLTTAKKIMLAFPTEEIKNHWCKNLDNILAHKFNKISNSINTSQTVESVLPKPSMNQFMIENDVYEGVLKPG